MLWNFWDRPIAPGCDKFVGSPFVELLFSDPVFRGSLLKIVDSGGLFTWVLDPDVVGGVAADDAGTIMNFREEVLST